jgi:hypothetical protein
MEDAAIRSGLQQSCPHQVGKDKTRQDLLKTTSKKQ